MVFADFSIDKNSHPSYPHEVPELRVRLGTHSLFIDTETPNKECKGTEVLGLWVLFP